VSQPSEPLASLERAAQLRAVADCSLAPLEPALWPPELPVVSLLALSAPDAENSRAAAEPRLAACR